MSSAAEIARSTARSWLPGVILAAGIAGASRRAGALSDGGAAGAILVGGTIFGRGGKRLAAPLIGFFISSSVLSRLGKNGQPDVAAITVKGGQRDLLQVLANGGVPAGLALAGGNLIPATTASAAYVGSLAVVTADTWSTEIGELSRRLPRSILSGKPVPAGLSGGVTPLGLAGAAAGGAMIGLLGWSVSPAGRRQRLARSVARSAVTGLVGSLIDSVLGASLQRIYYCPACDTLTEQAVHRCGTTTMPRRGYSWMTNDMVNFLTSLSGALAGARLIEPDGEG